MSTKGLFYTWTKGVKANLSNNISTKEMECPCENPSCVQQRIAVELVNKLQAVRNAANSPLRIHSAYRCREHQAALTKKGYQTARGVSQHELGNAADISTSAHLPHELSVYCKPHFKAIGRANNFLHVDLRNDKERAWLYGSPGVVKV